MPGWHELTEARRLRGELNVVGLIQEQHPARAGLFMQWKGMDWPLLVDSLDLLGIAVVPVSLLIDGHGIVRHRLPNVERGRATFDAFMEAEYEAPRIASAAAAMPELDSLRHAAESGHPRGWRDYGDGLFLWGGERRLDEAIAAYGRALADDADDAVAHFRLGVALRGRYDREERPDDFRDAVEHWSRALELDANNYIWLRRIQQYGPRLGKPYPFYDWVVQARDELRAAGVEPVELQAEPSAAELATPLRRFEAHGTPGTQPDPERRVRLDAGEFVRWIAVVVPARVAPGENARVHFELRPGGSKPAHWNNEVAGMTIWLDAPEGWRLERRRLDHPPAPAPISDEARRLEFEVGLPEDAVSDSLRAYALYYVCEESQGSCLYRRQELTIEIPVAIPAGDR